MAGSALLESDTVVVGGGIVGLCLAWFLATEGVEVAVLDDGSDAGTTANAGSLHVQIQSRLIRRFPELLPGVEAALPMYPLAVRHWQRLTGLLPIDIDLRLTGGLMVAEDEEQLDFLRAKAARERALGLEVEILDRRALDRIAPYLGPAVVGAERCASEGKVDPLAANTAIAAATRAAGVALQRGTRVLGITPDGAGYALRTTAGMVRAGRLVIAAGAGTGALLAPLGVAVPTAAEPLHMNVTEPAAPRAATGPACRADDHDEAARHGPARDRRRLAGAGRQGGRPPEVLRTSLAGNLGLAVHIVPEVARARLLRSWAGINTTTDGRSVLGPVPGRPGLYVALPGDAGYTLGPLVARLVADHMLGRRPELDLEAYTADRFRTKAPAF
ncbi:MAG: FAD-binding oxidoreductase [Geminicoccaceae bacterium]